MTDYIFQNQDESVKVIFRTDRIGDADQFNVLDIVGRSEAEEILGLTFERLVYRHQDMVDFANDNDLTVFIQKNGNLTGESVQTLAILESAMNNGTEQAAYSFQFTAVGGVPPYAWADDPEESGDNLVASLVIDADTGVVSGTIDDATAEVDRDVNIAVTDSLGTQVIKTVTHTIIAD